MFLCFIDLQSKIDEADKKYAPALEIANTNYTAAFLYELDDLEGHFNQLKNLIRNKKKGDPAIKELEKIEQKLQQKRQELVELYNGTEDFASGALLIFLNTMEKQLDKTPVKNENVKFYNSEFAHRLEVSKTCDKSS